MEVGALLPVMRTKRSGIAVPSYQRPQVFDEAHLEGWRRLTELHHQLNPYLRAADETYRRTGLPIVRHLVLAHPRSGRAQDADDEYLFGADLLAAPVTEPGVDERRAWVPPGRWVDWWASTRMAGDGAYRLGRARIARGGRERTLPAPLGEPPLLLRAGAVLPLLDREVETLSPYPGDDGLVRASDRERSLRLLVVPWDRSRSALPDGGSARSSAGGGSWELRLRSRAKRRYEIEASLSTIGLRPGRVLAGGRKLPERAWSYDRESGVLRASVAGRRVRLAVRD